MNCPIFRHSNSGSEPFADAQIDAVLGLLESIRQRYRIPGANIIGHADQARSDGHERALAYCLLLKKRPLILPD